MMNLAMNDHMNLAIHDHRLARPGSENAALRDYDSVRRAIAFISEHWRTQPTIEAMADAASVTPDELHHLFRRWAGRTPRASCAIPPACSTPHWIPGFRARDGCTICSSPMRRCRRANGRTAAPA